MGPGRGCLRVKGLKDPESFAPPAHGGPFRRNNLGHRRIKPQSSRFWVQCLKLGVAGHQFRIQGFQDSHFYKDKKQ